jgi:very-short-patch-repair endonuclease
MRGALPHLTNRSRSLRSSTTDAEARLWRRLRNRQLGGFKFVRQAPVGAYYIDFLCREARLVVEVDGSQHADSIADRQRDQELRALGYRVVRVWNNDISGSMDGVLEMLLSELEAALTLPRFWRGSLPLPACGERDNHTYRRKSAPARSTVRTTPSHSMRP